MPLALLTRGRLFHRHGAMDGTEAEKALFKQSGHPREQGQMLVFLKQLSVTDNIQKRHLPFMLLTMLFE